MRAPRVVFALLSVVSIAIFAIAIAGDASADEHVRNGSFEGGTEGWSAAYGASIGVAVEPEVTPADGVAAGKVTLADSRFEIRPAMSGAVAAGTYDVSAFVSAEGAGMTARVRVEGAGFEESRTVVLETGAWTPFALTITAPATGNVAITISGTGAPGDVVYVDGVRVAGAPPVTMTPTPVLAVPVTTVTGGVPSATATATATATPVVDTIAAYLRNPSFEESGEDGAPSGWAKYGGSLSSADSPVRLGARAARLDSGTASTKWLYQTVLVDAGETYAFDAWVWHDDAAVAAAFLRVSWYASADGSGAAIDSADSTARLDTAAAGYRYLTTGPVAAPPGARSARLRVMLAPMSTAAARIFVDDASFGAATPLPPPAPSAAAAAAAVGGASAADGEAARVSRAAGATRASAASGASSGVAAGPGAATLVINEVLYDPATGEDDAAGEWVEIYNRGTADVSLAGWALRDNARATSLPEIIVPAGDFAVVAASDGFFEAYPDFTGIAGWIGGRIGNGLGNDGDRLELLTPDGAVADAISWGKDATILEPAIDDVPAGHSIERRAAGGDSDASEDFVDNDAPSPGRPIESEAGNSKRQGLGSGVELLEASGASRPEWLPWGLVGLSSAALAGAAGWRAVDAFKARSRSA